VELTPLSPAVHPWPVHKFGSAQDAPRYGPAPTKPSFAPYIGANLGFALAGGGNLGFALAIRVAVPTVGSYPIFTAGPYASH
jgi:hypothetical protein